MFISKAGCMAAWLIGGCLLASPAWAVIDITGYEAARHERFYTGSNKAFLGDGLDWSGIGRSTSNVTWANMISPHFFVSAGHSAPAAGLTVRFYYTNNPADGYEDRQVLGGKTIGGDLYVGYLSTPVSDRIAKYAILDNVTNDTQAKANLIGQKMWQWGVGHGVGGSDLALGRNIVDAVSSYSFTHSYTTTAGLTHSLGQDEALAVGGDSGLGAYVTINNQPVLLGARSTTTSSSYAGYYASAIRDYMAFVSGGTQQATFVSIPEHSSVPVIRETFQNDAVNTKPQGGDQTVKLIASGLVSTAGTGGTYSDPFGGNSNKSLRLQATSATATSSVFLEGLQTGVVQGQCQLDFHAKAPGASSGNAMFNLRLGQDYSQDAALDASVSDVYNESNVKLALLDSGRLQIQAQDATYVSDQMLEFDQSHHLEIRWKSQGTADPYADILVDGHAITASHGQTTRFSLWDLAYGDIDRIDTVYLSMDYTGLSHQTVYIDNLYLADITVNIPEPSTILFLGVGVILSAPRRYRAFFPVDSSRVRSINARDGRNHS